MVGSGWILVGCFWLIRVLGGRGSKCKDWGGFFGLRRYGSSYWGVLGGDVFSSHILVMIFSSR